MAKKTTAAKKTTPKEPKTPKAKAPSTKSKGVQGCITRPGTETPDWAR